MSEVKHAHIVMLPHARWRRTQVMCLTGPTEDIAQLFEMTLHGIEGYETTMSWGPCETIRVPVRWPWRHPVTRVMGHV